MGLSACAIRRLENANDKQERAREGQRVKERTRETDEFVVETAYASLEIRIKKKTCNTSYRRGSWNKTVIRFFEKTRLRDEFFFLQNTKRVPKNQQSNAVLN